MSAHIHIESGTFAEACYDQNSISELQNPGNPDPIDMKTWGITAQEWKDQIALALAARLDESK